MIVISFLAGLCVGIILWCIVYFLLIHFEIIKEDDTDARFMAAITMSVISGIFFVISLIAIAVSNTMPISYILGSLLSIIFSCLYWGKFLKSPQGMYMITMRKIYKIKEEIRTIKNTPNFKNVQQQEAIEILEDTCSKLNSQAVNILITGSTKKIKKIQEQNNESFCIYDELEKLDELEKR